MGIKQLYNYNLQKLPNEYGDVSVMWLPCYPKKRTKSLGQTEKRAINDNINTFIAIALDETRIFVAVHFSMEIFTSYVI